jgi:thiol-disulfide isomerase/thioredoxin
MRTLAVVVAAVLAAGSVAGGQSPTTIVRDVRAAIAADDVAGAERLVEQARAERGDTPENLAALSWLGRAALAAGRHERAAQYAADTYELTVAALRTRDLDEDANLQTALGAAIEVEALARAARGDRSAAVYFLQRELETYGGSRIHTRIQKNLNVLSLEGQPAPALVAGERLGEALPGFDQLKGKPVLLFFWAHWCSDCKAQGPALARLLEKYGPQGLEIVAPTQLYGYVAARRQATPDEELRYIAGIRDEFYAFLQDEAAPVSEANHLRYGVSTTPTLALVDRDGIVRLYHPGQMTEEALEAAIRAIL